MTPPVNLAMLANPLNWGTILVWILLIGIAAVATKIVPTST
jgi:hypothetical protein